MRDVLDVRDVQVGTHVDLAHLPVVELLRVGRVALRDELRLRLLPFHLAFCQGGLYPRVVELRLRAVSLMYEHGHHGSLANTIILRVDILNHHWRIFAIQRSNLFIE